MSALDFLLLAGIAAACFFALRSIFRRKRRGGSCCGCCRDCGRRCPNAVVKGGERKER